MEKILTRTIDISYELLDAGLERNLTSEFKTRLEGTCDERDGYILQILSVNRIVDNCISNADSKMYFTAELRCIVLKPYTGQYMSGNIIIGVKEGVMVSITDKLKAFVPSEHMNRRGWSYAESKWEGVGVGDYVEIEVLRVKYEKNHYSCIAKFR